MRIRKPPSVAQDSFRSAKWDELTRGREFKKSDVPALVLLVQWYQVVDQCIEDMSANGGVQVAYSNDMGDIKALPQIMTMKQASAEIRALNKQLGILDGRDVGGGEVRAVGRKDSVLTLVQGRSSARRAGAG